MSDGKHLWEVDHPYYCNLGNCFSNNCGDKHDSWASFIEAYGDSDFDMNLVFRFDWLPANKKGRKHDELLIFWMGQRLGLYRFTQVEIDRKDEPAVRRWLQERFEYLAKLWEPLRLSDK